MTQSNVSALKELGAQLADKRKDCVLSWEIAFDELTICVAPSNLHNFVSFLKTDANCQFSSLVDITAVDYPERSDRFDVVYHFLSMYQNKRVRCGCQFAKMKCYHRSVIFIPQRIGLNAKYLICLVFYLLVILI